MAREIFAGASPISVHPNRIRSFESLIEICQERRHSLISRGMPAKPSALVDTRVIYCGDNLEQLQKLPAECADLIYIDPPFNSNRNYEVFWGETKEKRSFEDRHESTRAYIDYMRPRCEQLARVLKKTGSFYYQCDWHVPHAVKATMLGHILDELKLPAMELAFS